MKKLKRIIIITFYILGCIVFTTNGKNDCHDILKEVYYLPLSVRTYLPVTTKSIKKERYFITRELSCKNIFKLKKMIMPNDAGKFDSSMVRALLIFTDNTYYVDYKGCTIDLSGTVYQVDSTAFEGLMEKYSRF